jgi:uncharacterized protein (TIGR02452 family)
MEREDLIKVFAETVDCVNKGFYINKKGEKVEIPSEHDGLSIDNVTFYDSDIKKKINFDKLKRYSTEISVVNQDCLIAAKELYDDGYSPAVVNFASFKVPGGGVRKGSRAQEENLCRRTNLFESIFRFIDTLSKEYGLPLEKKRYPLPVNHGAIYSPSIAVFKASEEKNYEYLDEPFMVDIITIAALSHPNLTKDGNLAKWDRDVTKQKIRTMLNLGLYWENDSIVLGAFGCGAFANPPEDIAKAFKEVIDEPEYCDKYEKIVFAILDDHNSHREHNPRGNYLPFVETFSE